VKTGVAKEVGVSQNLLFKVDFELILPNFASVLTWFP
jgi:hypothetical protein